LRWKQSKATKSNGKHLNTAHALTTLKTYNLTPRRFKALQYLVVMYFAAGKFDKMVDRYRAMLNYISSVTRNECTEAINVILDTLATATDMHVLSEMYEITLIALKSSNNERLWFNTNLKLAKVYLEEKKWNEVERLIAALKEMCTNPDGSDDLSKGTLLLEIYCVEIQLCSATNNAARMKRIYPKTLNLNAAVADPRIMGIIREEGGKMQMAEGRLIKQRGYPSSADCPPLRLLSVVSV
jgi:COP9 signalosome complex subunit 2